MKRKWTRAEKTLFAAPLLFIALGFGAFAWRSSKPIRLDVPKNANVEVNVKNLAFSPDGTRLAVAISRGLLPDDEPKSLGQIVDVRTHSKICDLAPLPSRKAPTTEMFEDTPASYSLSWSPDGQRLVMASPYISNVSIKSGMRRLNYLCRFAVWNAENGELIGEYPYAPPTEDAVPDRMRFSADGQRIISNGIQPSIFDANSGERIQTFRVGRGAPIVGAINDELQLCAQSRTDNIRVQVFDIEFTSELGWNGSILSCQIHRFEEKSGVETLLLWDGKTGQKLPSPPCVDCSDLEFYRDNRTLAYLGYFETKTEPVSFEREIVVWDYRQHKILWRQPAGIYAQYLQASPDGKWLSLVEAVDINPYTPAILKIFDQTGKLHIEKPIGNFPTAWLPDSSRIAIVKQSSDGPPQIEFLRVGQ